MNFGASLNINSPSPYWNANNNSQNQSSALGYVPETTWNDSCTNNIFVLLNWGSTPEASCNNSQLPPAFVSPVGGGGGKSNCISFSGTDSSTCAGGYAKPAWQAAPGVPNDLVRDIPDVSLFASPGFVASAYIICEADQPFLHGSCSLNSPNDTFLPVGGTSVSAPAFAGIIALVNQSTGSAGQGNANYVLYKLASSSAQTSQSCGATSGSGQWLYLQRRNVRDDRRTLRKDQPELQFFERFGYLRHSGGLQRRGRLRSRNGTGLGKREQPCQSIGSNPP